MYRTASIVTAIVCVILFGLLVLQPDLYVRGYGVGPDIGGAFMARRASPMFLGFAVMLWLAKDLPVGTGRDAVCYGVAFMFAGIAFTGLYEFARGGVAATIIIAAIAEFVVAGVFVSVRSR